MSINNTIIYLMHIEYIYAGVHKYISICTVYIKWRCWFVPYVIWFYDITDNGILIPNDHISSGIAYLIYDS